MKFVRKRNPKKVMNFVYTKKYQFLLGKLDEYSDKEDDRLEREIIEILKDVRLDQALRVLSFLTYTCCVHEAFNVPGMEKDLKFVNDALGPDE